MSLLRQMLMLCFVTIFLTSKFDSVSCESECFMENFTDGDFDLFGDTCGGDEQFVIEKYDEDFERPDNTSNDFYMVNPNDNDSCAIFKYPLVIEENSSIVITYLGASTQNSKPSCFLKMHTESIDLNPMVLNVQMNEKWTEEKFFINHDQNITFEFVCVALKQSKVYIDNIKIIPPDIDYCEPPESSSTSESTSEITSTGSSSPSTKTTSSIETSTSTGSSETSPSSGSTDSTSSSITSPSTGPSSTDSSSQEISSSTGSTDLTSPTGTSHSTGSSSTDSTSSGTTTTFLSSTGSSSTLSTTSTESSSLMESKIMLLESKLWDIEILAISALVSSVCIIVFVLSITLIVFNKLYKMSILLNRTIDKEVDYLSENSIPRLKLTRTVSRNGDPVSTITSQKNKLYY